MYKNLVEKFKVNFIPDSAQSIYMGFELQSVNFETLTYPDGSIRVLCEEFIPSHRYYSINAHIQSMDDLMIVAQLKDIIERKSNGSKQSQLVITSTPYTRYDRVMYKNKDDSFGALVFANFVNSLGFDNVAFYDCHSNVMLDLIKNSIDYSQSQLVNGTVIGVVEGFYTIVAPDKGAVKKNPNASIICDKVRNAESGKITGVEISRMELPFQTTDLLVIDDICEGGRTFIEVAKLLDENVESANSKSLYVTHGLFSNNALDRLFEYYDNIHAFFSTKSLYDSLTEDQQNRLNLQNLINI